MYDVEVNRYMTLQDQAYFDYLRESGDHDEELAEIEKNGHCLHDLNDGHECFICGKVLDE